MFSVCSDQVDNGPFGPVVTGADVVKCIELGRGDVAEKLLMYAESSLDLSKRCASIRSASLRSGSSAGSSSSVSRSGGGLTGSRLQSIAKVDSWRAGGKREVGASAQASSLAVGSVPDGYCYVKLLGRSSGESVAVRLGSWPTLGALARLGEASFQSLDQLERFRLVPRGERAWHVSAGGSEGVSFLDVMSRCAGPAVRQGTLAAAVKNRVATGTLSGVNAGHRVGGNSVPVGSSVESRLLASAGVAAEVMARAARFTTGIPDEETRQEFVKFLSDCPSYLQQCPSLRSVDVVANSEKVLEFVLNRRKKYVCNVAFLDERDGAEVEAVFDRMFSGFLKTRVSGGFEYYSRDVQSEYYGADRVALAASLLRRYQVDRTYASGVCRYTVHPPEVSSA